MRYIVEENVGEQKGGVWRAGTGDISDREIAIFRIIYYRCLIKSYMLYYAY